MSCWRYGRRSSARASGCPTPCAKSAYAAGRCRWTPRSRCRTETAPCYRQVLGSLTQTMGFFQLSLLVGATNIKLADPFPEHHDPPMGYIEASDSHLRETGQIKLHGQSGF